MTPTGILSIDRAAGGDSPAVALARLYGPRGGIIGSTLIDDANAQEAVERLSRFIGTRARATTPTPDAAPKTQALVDRLRSMAAQIAETGLISYPDGHSGLSAVAAQEFAELVDELDKAGILGPQPDQPEPLMCCTITNEADDSAIDVFIVNGYRETQFLTALVDAADAHADEHHSGGYSTSSTACKRLPDYVLKPTPAQEV